MKSHRLCYISRNYRGVEGSGNKAKTDNEDTLQAMGACNLGLRRTLYDNKVITFFLDLAGIISYCFRVRKGDVILLQYPVKKYFSFICNVARARGARTVALIHDLGAMRRKRLTEQQEIKRLMHADYVIASNSVMAQWLKDKGYTNKLGALGFFDYRSATTSSEKSSSDVCRVVYAGALAMRKNAFILQMPDTIGGWQMHIYGNKSGLPQLKTSENIIFHNFVPADTFIKEADADFGLVWDGDSLSSCTGSFGEYLRWNSPHKVSFYIRAGLPIIIWREAALASLVEQEGIGICVDSINELNDILPKITKEQMEDMRRNVERVSRQLADGHYLRTSLTKAVHEITGQ